MAAGSPLGQTDVCSINGHGAGSSQGFQHTFAGLVHTLLGQFIRVLPITMADAILIGCQQPSICCISRNRSPSAFRVTTIIFKTFTLVFKHLREWQWRHFLLHSLLVRTLLGDLTDHLRVWQRRHYLLHCPFAPTLLGNVVDRAVRWPCCRVLGSVVFQSFAGKTVEFGIWDNNWRSNCSSASGIRKIRT